MWFSPYLGIGHTGGGGGVALRIMRTWQARGSWRERRKNNQFSFRNYFERHPSIHPSSFSPWVGPTNNIRSQLFSALLSKRYHKQKRQDKCLVDQENRCETCRAQGALDQTKQTCTHQRQLCLDALVIT